MSRRQLPLIRPTVANERPAHQPGVRAVLDPRWLVVVCEAGLDVAAPWLAALLEALAREACVAELVVDALVAPISASARSLVVGARPWLPPDEHAPASAAALQVLASDVLRDYVGARAVLVLVDRVPSRSPQAASATTAFLRPDRVRGAAEIGRELALSLRVAM